MIRTQSIVHKLLRYRAVVALAVLGFLLLLPDNALAAKKDKGQSKDTGIKGSISAIDKSEKTITVSGKKIVTDGTTVFTKAGKPIGFDDLKTGDAAEVSTFALGDKLTAVTVRVGGAPPAGSTPTETPKKKKKDKA